MLGTPLDEISPNLAYFLKEKTHFKKVFWSSRSGFSEFSVLATWDTLPNAGLSSEFRSQLVRDARGY